MSRPIYINNPSMTHRFPIKELAAQSGLSTATVDRVLNGRPNVSAQTKARVHSAMDELQRQAGQLAARGRRLFIDVVMEAPQRFTREVRAASEAVLPHLHPVVIRPRFTLHETMSEQQTLACLARISKRGSHGVCLKARDTARIRAAIDCLQGRGIPVVTLVTDIPETGRIGYAGLDNHRAGATAGQLMTYHVSEGQVLTLQSRGDFVGEEERRLGFASTLSARAPNVQIVPIEEGGGLDMDTKAAVKRALQCHKPISGIYSMGGGNRAVAEVLKRAGVTPKVFIGHDLDADNLGLLEREVLTYVLHHDLEGDMLNAFRQIMAYHKLISPSPGRPSDIQIIAPGNIPYRYRT